jgi:hypothetical protein
MVDKKERIRDKFWDENDPLNDVDFIEVSAAPETLDELLRKYAPTYVQSHDGSSSIRHRVRRKRLIRKIFKAAATCLTDRQFQIFVLRNVLAYKETVIANQLGVNQSYIANVLKISYVKIQNTLRLKVEKPEIPNEEPETL